MVKVMMQEVRMDENQGVHTTNGVNMYFNCVKLFFIFISLQGQAVKLQLIVPLGATIRLLEQTGCHSVILARLTHDGP